MVLWTHNKTCTRYYIYITPCPRTLTPNTCIIIGYVMCGCSSKEVLTLLNIGFTTFVQNISLYLYYSNSKIIENPK